LTKIDRDAEISKLLDAEITKLRDAEILKDIEKEINKDRKLLMKYGKKT
jgi:hypothetical protein